jgi:hypothetical protein
MQKTRRTRKIQRDHHWVAVLGLVLGGLIFGVIEIMCDAWEVDSDLACVNISYMNGMESPLDLLVSAVLDL